MVMLASFLHYQTTHLNYEITSRIPNRPLTLVHISKHKHENLMFPKDPASIKLRKRSIIKAWLGLAISYERFDMLSNS